MRRTRHETIKKPATYVPIRKDRLTNDARNWPETRLISPSVKETPQELHVGQMKYNVLDILQFQELDQSERMVEAIEFGKRFILDVLGKKNIANPESMRVMMFDPEYFQRNLGSNKSGVVLPGLEPVFVMQNERDFEWFTASVAVHEMAHSWIDMQVVGYHESDNPDQETRDTFFAQLRSGLKVRKIVRQQLTGETINEQHTGEFMNELGNHALQMKFIRDLFADERMRTLFSEEIAFQDEHLKQYVHDHGLAPEYPISLFDNDNNKYFLMLNITNLFWDKTGNLMIRPLIIISQLVDDLSELIGTVDGQPFIEALVNLKIHPERQNAFRRAIDAKLGPGFYKRLKGTPYNSSLEHLQLLIEVQTALGKGY